VGAELNKATIIADEGAVFVQVSFSISEGFTANYKFVYLSFPEIPYIKFLAT